MKDGNHAAILAQLGKIGFTGVETAGLYGLKPAELRRLVEDNGMVVSSAHIPFPNRENLAEVIDQVKGLGTTYAVSGFWLDDWKDLDAIKRTADKTAFAIKAMAKAGLTFVMHNHWVEFERLGGRFKYDWLLDRCPELQFEIDTYWACNFGAEVPAEQVQRYRKRTPLIHCKDGHFVRDQPMTACGAGKQDFPAIFKATDAKTLKWAIVELDACATDMLAAVAGSYRYLTRKKLAKGRK
jgi:sugar phosphate isomerase/epimerase